MSCCFPRLSARVRSLAVILALAGLDLPALFAAEAVSSLSTLDTRGDGELVVSGRVIDSSSQLPIAGVALEVNGSLEASAADGTFRIANVVAEAPLSLLMIKEDFLQRDLPILLPPPELKSIDLGDVLMTPTTEGPYIESLTLEPNLYFLAGYSPPTEAKIIVNWNEQNPGELTLFSNRGVIGSLSGPGPNYTMIVDVDQFFKPSPSPQNLTAFVTTAEGAESERLSIPVNVFDIPGLLKPLAMEAVSKDSKFALDFALPAFEQSVNLPLLGKYGFGYKLGGSFDYGFDDGSWELAFGVKESGSQGKRGRRPRIPGFTNYDRPRL